MSFENLRVLSLESRRSKEIATLIRTNEGDPFVAPSMRETPLEENHSAFAFAENLLQDKYDMILFLTGVGTRALHKLLITKHEESALLNALRRTTRVARGPKPSAALRELGIPADILVPEPNTWRELLTAIEGRAGKNIAVQEYGRSNTELLDGLKARGADVTQVRIYQWALPEDTAPLREAARQLAAGKFDVALFTTSIQIPHLLQMAREEGVEEQALWQLRRNVAVASIGPTCSEMLEDFDICTDITPSHPKMGILVKEAGEQAQDILTRKRGGG